MSCISYSEEGVAIATNHKLIYEKEDSGYCELCKVRFTIVKGSGSENAPPEGARGKRLDWWI